MTITEYQLRLAREPTFPVLPDKVWYAFLLKLSMTALGREAVARAILAKGVSDGSLPGR